MSRVKAGVFSLTAAAPTDDGYLQWHLLDHMPEQYRLPGIVHGLRWIADGDYPANRIASHGRLREIANVVHYLVGDPVRQTLEEFVTLGRDLRENGRMPEVRPLLQIAGSRLLQWHSAPRVLVSAEVVPFRPHRGVLLIIEEPAGDRPNQWLEWLHAEHYPALLAMAGTAGAWMFGSTTAWDPAPRGWQTNPHYTTVVYLDDDPLNTTAALAPIIEERWRSDAARPLFAGPLRSMISWEAWPRGN